MESKLYHYSAEVTRVVDGDTVDAFVDLGFDMHSKQRVRLYGINTPECRTRDKEEKVAGFAAKARLKEMLRENKNKCVIKTRLDKKGKFGRVLGVLYVGKKDLNKTLVSEGHAKPYYGQRR
tara:strand:+ start:1157 stop:1519 length:363 start_codon:yes stop_codon:yes gene_type:complete